MEKTSLPGAWGVELPDGTLDEVAGGRGGGESETKGVKAKQYLKPQQAN